MQSVTQLGTSNGGLWEFHIPKSEFKDAFPAANASSTAATMFTSAFGTVSEDTLRAYTTFAYNKYGISFTYAENADYATVLIA